MAAPGRIGPFTLLLLAGQVLPVVLAAIGPGPWTLLVVAASYLPRVLAARRFQQSWRSQLSKQYASCDYDVRHNVSGYGMYQIPFHSSNALLRHALGGGSASETLFLHSGLPFSVLSQDYSANGKGVFQNFDPAQTIQFAVPNYAKRVPGVPLYRKTAIAGVTVAGAKQWLNPDAFVSTVDPSTGDCYTGQAGIAPAVDNASICQFGDSGRNSVRGLH